MPQKVKFSSVWNTGQSQRDLRHVFIISPFGENAIKNAIKTGAIGRVQFGIGQVQTRILRVFGKQHRWRSKRVLKSYPGMNLEAENLLFRLHRLPY